MSNIAFQLWDRYVRPRFRGLDEWIGNMEYDEDGPTGYAWTTPDWRVDIAMRVACLYNYPASLHWDILKRRLSGKPDRDDTQDLPF